MCSETSNPPESKETIILDSFRTVLNNHSHLFACGGAIQVKEPSPTQSASNEQARQDIPIVSDPITVRYDVTSRADASFPPCAKLVIPENLAKGSNLTDLVTNCKPATFGRGGEDVYDETYRKALKMDTDAFLTSFDPYSVGIIDTVAQILLPSKVNSTTHRAVRAELYKLNIYSAPSGKFKSHVDTPRSELQFGSLVVCLPAAHEGGQLKVRHGGEEMAFDWSQAEDGKPAIQWAAFYSDCEHEVMEVTSGHRVTLTYNLYAVRGAGRLTGVSPTLNPAQLPLFQTLKGVLDQDLFKNTGATLGFWCSHVYAYNETTETPLPDTLKGVDAIIWESLRELGLDPKIRPVIPLSEDFRERIEDLIEYDEERPEGLPDGPLPQWVIGRKFGVKFSEVYRVESVEDSIELFKGWGDFVSDPIHWLNKSHDDQLQIVYTAYGNDATTDAYYSRCAILVEVPKKSE